MNKPFLPSDLTNRPPNLLAKAAFAHLMAEVRGVKPAQFAATRWKDDEALDMVVRAAVPPATTTSPTWAGALARTAV